MPTKIDWADEVWNPTTGCTKVSAGCKNCYAEHIAGRFWGERKFTDVQCHPERLEIPLKWKKPRRIFVDSMSDLFHPDVPDEFIERVFFIMQKASWHTFMVLTKRGERMYEFMSNRYPRNWSDPSDAPYPMPNNIWLGVSVENQQTADERIPWLLRTPAAVRFVSYEPALSPVDFWAASGHNRTKWATGFSWFRDSEIHWIIAGCESGPGARPANPDWFRSVRDQCQVAGVPFFLKQMFVDGKLTHMPALDGIVWDQMPEVKNARNKTTTMPVLRVCGN